MFSSRHFSKRNRYCGNLPSNTISALVSVRRIASGQDATFSFSEKCSYQKSKYRPKDLDG